MRLSISRVSAGDGTADWEDSRYEVSGHARRRMTLAMSVALVVGCVGLLFTATAKPAGAAGTDTPIQFASGQVFASVGNSAVKVFSQGQPSATPPTSAHPRRHPQRRTG